MKRKPSIPDQRASQMQHLREIVRDVQKGLDELDNVILEAFDAYAEYEDQCDDDWPMLAEVMLDGFAFTYWLSSARDQVLTLLNELATVKYQSISSR